MYHRGLISLDNVTKGSSYKPETFMSILRKYLIENLRKTYKNVSSLTFRTFLPLN